MTPWALALALVGCAPDAKDQAPSCTEVTFFADADMDGHGDSSTPVAACAAPDGYTTESDDCDDGNAEVHPGADELCNEVDDDCDTSIDEDAIDATGWYEDTDLDGFGSDATVVACTRPSGHVDIGGDCDDGDPDINPDADELCNDVDDDCDSLVDSLDPSLTQGTIWYVDADSDGFGDPATGAHACEPPADRVSTAEDCDDTNIAIHPDADERCNATDDDCDGAIDEEPIDGTTFYADSDGDGLGDADVELAACTQPIGYVAEATDCDDGDALVGASPGYYDDIDGDGYGDGAAIFTCTPAADQVLVDGDCEPTIARVNPGATEECNSRDDNCDGLVDDDDPLVVATTYYADDDGDGFGDPKDTVASCGAVSGYVDLDRFFDCDDTDAAINRDATEYCDGVDNDCDGSVDNRVAYEDWYADDDGDGYGDSDDTKNDCVPPSGYVLADGDCDDTVATTNPGSVEVCPNDVDDDCDGGIDNCVLESADADALVEGDAENFGYFLAVADSNGDKVADLVVSSHYEDDIGSVFIAAGPVSASLTLADMVELQGPAVDRYFGESIDGRDMDLDEVDDILVGAYPSARAYLFLGPVTADRASTDADVILEGASDSGAGSDVDAVDFDADGYSDVAVGAYATDMEVGAVYVASGPVSADIDLVSDAAWVFDGASADDWLGIDVVDANDVSGDGIHDLAVAARSGNGTVYVVDGGAAPGEYRIDLAASVAIEGPDSGSGFGGVNGLVTTDYDGDGTIDLVAGAYDAASRISAYGGGVWGFLGPLSGTLDVRDADANWLVENGVHWLGMGVAAGDIDADGSTDLAFGAPEGNSPFVYVQFGLASGAVEVSSLPSIQGEPGELPGTAVALVPDWTGDGGAELVFGVPNYHDDGGSIVGGFAVFLSEGLY